MKKLLLAVALCLAATGHAEASQSTAWYGGQWTCNIAGSKKKLFLKFRESHNSVAALQDPPYYQKTTFLQVRWALRNKTVVGFYFGNNVPTYVELHMKDFRVVPGGLRYGTSATGKLLQRGRRWDLNCFAS